MNGDGFGVGTPHLSLVVCVVPDRIIEHEGWYDSVHDEELGSQPCIFTSVTPVECQSTS